MKGFIVSAAVCILLLLQGCSNNENTATDAGKKSDTLYTCLPCGYGCDTISYTHSGTCSHCNMKLVAKASISFGTVNPEDLCSFIAGKGPQNVVLLDVRTPEEFNGTAPDKFGRLANAINIPLQQLAQRIHELDTVKNKEIIVYCSHSHRSPAASYLLTENGFARVSNLAFGMSEWRNRVTQKDTCNYYIQQ